MAKRTDKKGRILQTGEYYDEKTGRYKYRYKDNEDKWQTIYSWTLTHNDRIPAGRNQKSGESLREKEAQVQKDLLEVLNSSKGNMKLVDLMELYIQTRWKDVKQTTKAGYTTQLNFMKTEPFGQKKIGDITETLSREDMRKFLDFVRYDKHFRVYFDGMYVLFNTGLRISEFCGLTIDDLDFKNHTIHIHKQLLRGMVDGKNTYYIEDTTKTDCGERYVPMSDDVESCLQNIIKNRPTFKKEIKISSLDGKMKVSGFLFFDKNKNLEVAQHWENHFRWALQKYNKIYKDELHDVTPHVARHTFCSNMASAGMNPKNLQYIMGHSDISITMNVYTHVQSGDTTEEYRRIVNGLNTKQYTMYDLKRESDIYVPQIDSVEDDECMDDIV